MKQAAHKMVADLAVKMAQEVYEECAKDNEFFARFPKRNVFVKNLAPQLIPEARGVLTDLLQSENISDIEREDIFNALVLDKTLPRGRNVAIQ